MQRNRRYVLGAIVVSLLSACAHHPQVNCAGPLQPINRPAAVVGVSGSQSRESADTAAPRFSNSESSGKTDARQASVADRSTSTSSANTPERAP
jgi:hypothetical protein